MRLFKAPGKKQKIPIQGKGIGGLFNKIVNAAYTPLNWIRAIKPKVTSLKKTKVHSKDSMKPLSGGRRRSKHKFLQLRKESWWVRGHKRKAHRRGGPYKLRQSK